LVFVAVLALLVVGIYVANKGKPKEATMFGGGGPAPAAPTAEPTATPDTRPVSGIVRVEAGVEVPTGATLFITARPSSAQGKGPPLAAKRVQAPTFPFAFTLGPNDRMIAAMPWTGPVDVSARLDLDGNATTREPGTLTSGPGPSNVALGRTDVELVLRPEG
jgi:hypothetical protein